MKSILTEIVLSGGAIVFWAAALPAAIIALPAIALWEKTANLLVRETQTPNCSGPSPLAA
jgi:hypothetical protein